MPFIIHYFNGSPMTHYELGDQLRVGRADRNDLQIDDATVSGEHAVIERGPEDEYQVRDLGSTNGVLYRGDKVECQVLQDGDFMTLGTHELQYVTVLPEPLQRTSRIKKSWIPGVFYTSDK